MALKKKPRGKPTPANLKPFPKGVSGNPGGKPKFAAISEAIRHMLTLSTEDLQNYQPQTVAEDIAWKQLQRAQGTAKRQQSPDAYSVAFIADRAEGKALQTVRQSLTLDGAEMVFDITKPPEQIEKDVTPGEVKGEPSSETV